MREVSGGNAWTLVATVGGTVQAGCRCAPTRRVSKAAPGASALAYATGAATATGVGSTADTTVPS